MGLAEEAGFEAGEVEGVEALAEAGEGGGGVHDEDALAAGFFEVGAGSGGLAEGEAGDLGLNLLGDALSLTAGVAGERVGLSRRGEGITDGELDHAMCHWVFLYAARICSSGPVVMKGLRCWAGSGCDLARCVNEHA